MEQNDRAGLLYTMAGFVLLSCGDAVIKTMAGMWAPTGIAMMRYAIGAIGLSALLFAVERKTVFSMPRPGLQWLRGFSVGMATIGFFAALFVMPLAEATTIVFVSPMITGLLAPLFLKERARAATFIASAIAFVGVIVVLRPNFADLGLAALLPLVSAVGMSLLFMANRAAAGLASALAMQAYISATAAVILVAATVFGHVSGNAALALDWPHWSVIARCAIVAFSASVAHWLIYLGTTRAGAATVAPTTYVQLVVAITLGWLLFEDRPDIVTLLGGAIIIGAGLFLWREGRVKDVPMSD